MPSKGVFSSSFQATPFKGVFNSSFQAMPYEGVSNIVQNMPFENISVQAMPHEGIPIFNFHAMPLRSISCSLLQTMPIETTFQGISFEGITCSLFQALPFEDICYFSPQVMSLNNIQSVYVACEYCSQLYAYWYLDDFVTQLVEVIVSYLSPVIRFLLECLQKIIIWYNDFMLHWVTALHKTKNSI